MVDALTRIHAALVPRGVLVDTQPVSPRLPVTLDGEPIGELEDDEWLQTVAAVDAEIDEPAAVADDGDRGLRELYVALTRPTKTLVVVHARPLPEPLG